eukprot:scaffold19351_cov17-Tisochrysis_lutea.AAC.1
MHVKSEDVARLIARAGDDGCQALQWCSVEQQSNTALPASTSARARTVPPSLERNIRMLHVLCTLRSGGPYGHSESVRMRADETISLSSLVLNHQDFEMPLIRTKKEQQCSRQTHSHNTPYVDKGKEGTEGLSAVHDNPLHLEDKKGRGEHDCVQPLVGLFTKDPIPCQPEQVCHQGSECVMFCFLAHKLHDAECQNTCVDLSC